LNDIPLILSDVFCMAASVLVAPTFWKFVYFYQCLGLFCIVLWFFCVKILREFLCLSQLCVCAHLTSKEISCLEKSLCRLPNDYKLGGK
jgi:hypothetical protein